MTVHSSKYLARFTPRLRQAGFHPSELQEELRDFGYADALQITPNSGRPFDANALVAELRCLSLVLGVPLDVGQSEDGQTIHVTRMALLDSRRFDWLLARLQLKRLSRRLDPIDD